jgi:hypothetical protein
MCIGAGEDLSIARAPLYIIGQDPEPQLHCLAQACGRIASCRAEAVQAGAHGVQVVQHRRALRLGEEAGAGHLQGGDEGEGVSHTAGTKMGARSRRHAQGLEIGSRGSDLCRGEKIVTRRRYVLGPTIGSLGDYLCKDQKMDHAAASFRGQNWRFGEYSRSKQCGRRS